MLSSTNTHRWVLSDRVQQYKFGGIPQPDLSTLNVPLYKLQAVLRNSAEISELSLRIRNVHLSGSSDPLQCISGHRIHGASVKVHLLLDTNYDKPSSPLGGQLWKLLISTHLTPTLTNLTTSSQDPIPYNQIAIICRYPTLELSLIHI